ncbi:MAG: hypothetical protein JWP48_5227 [Actinoallomurus sp.]|nr:hypothetical protein [Actinoallomurus sp.]
MTTPEPPQQRCSTPPPPDLCEAQILLDVATALADATITAGAFSTVQFVEVAVHADEEDVQVRQEPGQFVTPGRELDHMLDDQIVAGSASAGRQRWNPAKKRGRIWVNHANGPEPSRRSGSMPAATN